MDPLGASRQTEPLAPIDAIHRHKSHQPPQPNHHRVPPDHPPSSPSHTPALGDEASYKQLKEAWIADQTGSSIHLVNTLGLVMLTTYAIWAVIRAKRLRFVRSQDRRPVQDLRNPILVSLFRIAGRLSDWQLEYLVLIVPAVGAHTVLAQHLLLTNAALVAILLVLAASGPPMLKKAEKEQSKRDKRHWSKKHSDDEDDEDLNEDNNANESRSAPTPDIAAAQAELPFRVSIDSAADAAHAAAAPPNFYDGPGSSYRDADLSVDTNLATAPQSPLLNSASSSHPPCSTEALLSPDMASTSSFSSTARPVELATPKANLLHSRDGSDGQSVVSASSAMSPLARSVVDPWNRTKAPSSLDHASSTTVGNDESTSSPQHIHPPPSVTSSQRVEREERSMFVRPQPFLTVYRAHMMLVTIISILAVDFPVFPRSLSKTESWGTSWMDMGVGSFVFSLGLISALPFLKSPQNRFRPLRQQVVSDFRKSLPLLLLGSVRVLMVKGVEYPEHVTEYGVHWNFFYTLAVLPFAATLSRPFSRSIRYSILGLALSVIHEGLLTRTNWQEWALSNEGRRNTLLRQNKEGVTSMVGYLAIFYIGLDLGHYVLPLDPYFAYRKLRKRRSKPRTDKLAMVLASLAILWWLGFAVVRLVGMGVSRRLANLGYVLWVVAFNTSSLLGYVLVYLWVLQPVEQVEQQSADRGVGERVKDAVTPMILEDLNRHSLTVFLAANLLTGLVNVLVKTMYTRDAVAMTVLLGYTGVCCALARLLAVRGIRLKF
ncbi:related to GWT1 - GPI-anchored wall transfer protein [Ustilago sp. UG-2017b]|nr:related to GWT1 - GPI-anchored wall transfer protein [Ustilago sp. UG-2017b]